MQETSVFLETSLDPWIVLASFVSVALMASEQRETAESLRAGLHSNREIGVAMGVLMHQHQFTRQEAFDVLRVASQNTNRKLADIALEVADTGALTIDHHAEQPAHPPQAVGPRRAHPL